MTNDFSPAEFGEAWQKFIDYINSQTPPPEPPPPFVVDRIITFLGGDPTQMIIVKEIFPEYDLPNLQIALDRFLTGPDRAAEQTGYLTDFDHPGFNLSTLLTRRTAEGPVQYRSVELANGERLQCMERGLYFVRDHHFRLVIFIHFASEGFYGSQPATVEILCPLAERAEAVLAEIRRLIHENNIYRGQVLTLGVKGNESISFYTLPKIEREAIILPAALLQNIEQNTLGFVAQAPRLHAAGRHLKRGLLFHGPPGAGKTLTIMYLLAQLKGRTVILLIGRVMGLIARACQLARALAPAVVVLEDVDLIALERENENTAGPVLFELLNEMDGLAEDTDVLFILSSNRPDLLEPALTARPGRIDQAIEFPLPDADCRRRLIQLYGQGLALHIEDLDDIVQRTEGVSSAFIRELLRKATLIAANQSQETSGPLIVADSHLREALYSIIAEGGALTQKLLGVNIPAATAS